MMHVLVSGAEPVGGRGTRAADAVAPLHLEVVHTAVGARRKQSWPYRSVESGEELCFAIQRPFVWLAPGRAIFSATSVASRRAW